MSESEKYFVFMFPAKSEIRDLLNLAVFILNPREKWPAHITVAGPFRRRPSARAQAKFKSSAFSLGAWNFFSEGRSTVYLKAGVPNIRKYWSKPDFIGNPVPHISIYNGKDLDTAKKIFHKIEPLRLIFGFNIEGIEIVRSSSQRQFDLRSSVNLEVMPGLQGMKLDDAAALSIEDRIDFAAEALAKCKPSPPLQQDLPFKF
ncbi:2'-5' RNA ligase family protein [Erythrobacter sp. LQ02-29]|uniref:2'-5' RNA ligase family protein n=1 Tax=Erythrobacter sp. LQ02-29 TaxID=2920384 RepID=UPI001F4D46B7|nr:2'-5' RNA ligase family protein [Erythrobacter sp. LQ02-29]MCP9221594.1 2'-5' RNA ligase family protein [Erythrobacter sp. LQ02-29]